MSAFKLLESILSSSTNHKSLYNSAFVFTYTGSVYKELRFPYLDLVLITIHLIKEPPNRAQALTFVARNNNNLQDLTYPKAIKMTI